MINHEIDRLTEIVAYFNTLPDGHMVVDEDSNIIAANQAMEVLTGYSVEDLHKMNVRDLIPEGVKSPHDGKLSKIIQNGSARNMKIKSAIPLLRRNGEVVTVDVERRVYVHPDGRRCFAGIVTPARVKPE